MVESRAWMIDHKPQKKWDARENLYLKRHGHSVMPRVLVITVSCGDHDHDRHLSSPVDLHVEPLLHFHLVLFTQVIKPWIGLTQITLNEVELRERDNKFTQVSSQQVQLKREDISVLISYTHLLGL